MGNGGRKNNFLKEVVLVEIEAIISEVVRSNRIRRARKKFK